MAWGNFIFFLVNIDAPGFTDRLFATEQAILLHKQKL